MKSKLIYKSETWHFSGIVSCQSPKLHRSMRDNEWFQWCYIRVFDFYELCLEILYKICGSFCYQLNIAILIWCYNWLHSLFKAVHWKESQNVWLAYLHSGFLLCDHFFQVMMCIAFQIYMYSYNVLSHRFLYIQNLKL